MSFRTHDKLIIHCCYHKAGTHWFHNIFKGLSTLFHCNYQHCPQKELLDGTELFLDDHCRVDLSSLRPHVGSHMIRDPRDIIVSGYFYHLWCDEAWCISPLSHLNDKTYRQSLLELSEEDGIQFELENEGAATIRAMGGWRFGNPDFIEVKYEELIAKEEEEFERIFNHYGFNRSVMKQALEVTKNCSFCSVAGRALGEEDRKSFLRKGLPGDWKNHFTAMHKGRFKELFPNVLQQLGYETDGHW